MATISNVSLNDIMAKLKLIKEEIIELRREKELDSQTMLEIDNIIENKKWLSKKESKNILNSL